MTTLARDTFCSFCGTKYGEPLTYPRTCTGCSTQVWANPIPVCVALVPVVDGRDTGLLMIRRAVDPRSPAFAGSLHPGPRSPAFADSLHLGPGAGKLALVGGFLEDHESWQVGCAREVREETGVEIDPLGLQPMWYASSAPKPNRVLLFAVAREIQVTALPPFTPNTETAERGLVFGFGGLDDLFAFPLHAEAARRFFAERGISGLHAYTPR